MSISYWEEAAQEKYEFYFFLIENQRRRRRILRDYITRVKQERFLRKIKDSSESISFPVVHSHVKALLDVE